MNEQITKPRQGISPGIIALIIILSLITVGLIIWLIFTNSDLGQLKTEKEQMRIELQNEVDSLLAEHNRTKEEYGMLADSLYAKDSVIQANAKEIKKLLNYKWEYYKVKKKVTKLQEIAQGYVVQMDSLYRVNKALKDENIQIRRTLEKEVARTEELTLVKEELTQQVTKASVLQTYDLTADAIQEKWGGDKEKVTDKAKRVDKIKICFTLSENPILPHGAKALYIRIARPDKIILTPSRGDDYSFMYQGEKLQFSIMKEVNYTGQALDMCLYWKKRNIEEEMMVGTYYVEIFADDNVIGATNFSLR